MESKCPDETLHMRGMNLILCILHILENISSLVAAHIISHTLVYYIVGEIRNIHILILDHY